MCLGIFVADVLAKPIDGMPERGQLELIDRVELHTGGCANNTSIALARLGFHPGVMGKVGQDWFGNFVIENLRKEGIDIRGVQRDTDANTSLTFGMSHHTGTGILLSYIADNHPPT